VLATFANKSRALLSRRRAQAAPGVADLVVMHLGRVVRRLERLDVEPAGGGEQRIGRDHPVVLRPDQPRAGGHEVLLRIEHFEGRALSRRRFFLHAGKRDARGAHLRLGDGVIHHLAQIGIGQQSVLKAVEWHEDEQHPRSSALAYPSTLRGVHLLDEAAENG
jgi:hypothetical protein